MGNDIKRKATLLRDMAEKILKGRMKKKSVDSKLSANDTLKLIHELEVHQIELEMQNDELIMVNKEMAISQTATTKYTELYDYAPSGYFTLTRDGEIIDLNLNAAKKLGIEQTQLKKKKFGFFVSDETRPIFNEFLEQVYKLKTKVSCQVVLISRSNVSIHVHMTGLLFEEKGWCFLSVTDITDRILLETHREITRKTLQLLNEPGNLKETVHKALSELKNLTGYDAIGIRIQKGDDFPYLDQIGFKEEFLKSENTLVECGISGKVCLDKEGHPKLACNCGLVISGKAGLKNSQMTKGGSWWVNDSTSLSDIPAKEDTRFHPRNRCIQQGFSSIALVPIHYNETIIGLMQFNDHLKDRFNQTVVEYLEEIASHFGAALLRKQAEEKLIQSEELNRLLFENSGEGILLTHTDGSVYSANPEACRMFGRSEEEIIKLARNGLTDLNDSRWQGMLDERRRTGSYKGELNFLRNDGTPFPAEISSVIFKDSTGKERTSIFFRDITKRKKTEKEILTYNARLNLAMKVSDMAWWEMNIATGAISFDRRKAEMLGYNPKDFKHYKDFMKLVHPEDAEKAMEAMRQHMYGKAEKYEVEYRILAKSGEYKWFYDLGSITERDATGKAILATGLVTNITERKKAQEALKISEEKFRNLVWGLQVGVMLFTPDYKISLSNPKAFELLGLDRNRLDDGSFIIQDMKVIHEDGTSFQWEDQPAARVIATGIAVRDCILGVFTSPGVLKWMQVQAEPQFGKDGLVQQVLSTFIDISELKKKDNMLQRLNKTLAALSKSSQVMVQSNDEAEYLHQVCNIVKQDCGYAMVWIGFAEESEAKSINPVASAGFEDGYLENILLSWDDTEFGKGPTGTAIRTGKTSGCFNILTDPNFIPWREEALKRGYTSSLAIPLINGEKTFGALTIYSRELDPVTDDEVKLLNELANDLAYGIIAIRLKEAHREAQEALSKSYDNSEELVKIRTRELEVTNEHLNDEIRIRVQQEQTLKRAEEKYRTVADFTYNMETWLDTNGNYIYVSPSCNMVTGYTADEFMNDPSFFIKIVHPDDKKMVEKHFKEKNWGDIQNFSMDFRIITPDGDERWVGHSCQKVFNTQGKYIGRRGSNRNITEQKNAELVLIDSKDHLRALTHRMDVVAEEERIRISREIHDELGHLLTAVKYDVEGMMNHSDLTIEFVKSELSALNSMIESLIDSVRKIATELRPGILDHLGLFPALEWKIKQFRMKNKILCDYQMEEMNLEFDKDETTIIYRILQEIFTNVTRHSLAKNLWINIASLDGLFIMKVRDNGIGFEFNESLQSGSLGLLGMHERAMSIGGNIQIESAPGAGTTVIFSLKKQNA